MDVDGRCALSAAGTIDQRTLWWREARLAIRHGRLSQARRLLRWIVTSCPADQDAWLRLASLAAMPEEQVACLVQACAAYPDSPRLWTALLQARNRQLEASDPEDTPQQVTACRRFQGWLPRAQISWVAAWPKRLVHPAHTWFLTLRERPSGRQAAISKTRSMLAARSFSFLSCLDQPAWLSFLLPLLAYLLTTCSTVYNLDSAEFSAAVYVLGIVRSTGYPLYLLVGKLFTWLLPVGDVAFRLNVMSAVCAAGTVALLYQIVRRLTKQQPVALAAALLLAFSYYFWAQSVVAEVYTLHTLLMSLLFLLLLRWEANRDDRLLSACAFLYGLSFGNHLSTVLLAPGMIVFCLAVGGRQLLRPRRLAFLVAAFLAGLAVYLYVPLRYLARPPFNYAGSYDAAGQFVPRDMTQLANLWWLISGQGFQPLMFDYSPLELLSEIGQAAYRFWGTFLGIGLVPALLGVWVQSRRRPHHLALFGLAFAANLAFFVNYRVVDKETMFIPVYLIAAVWVGEGYAWLVRWACTGLRSPSPLRFEACPAPGGKAMQEAHPPAWAWGLAALAVVALIVNWPLVDLHGDTRARDRADAALSLAQPQGIILGWWTSAPPLHYEQMVEGKRPDVLVINRFLIGAEEMYTLINRSLDKRRPVYVMELDEGLIDAYQVSPVGPMFELTPRLQAHQVAETTSSLAPDP